MSACEKCWTEAFDRMTRNPRKSQYDHYRDLLDEHYSGDHIQEPTEDETHEDAWRRSGRVM